MDFDVVIIGGGHNGLTCGAYLARAGLSTAVVERRSIIGGCATTESLIPEQPDFLFQGGATELLGFRDQPVFRDFDLGRFGLELIDSDPLYVMPFPNGKHIFIHRSWQKTADSIAMVSQEDAEAYARYYRLWGGLDELIGPFYTREPPLPGRRPLPAGASRSTNSLRGATRGLPERVRRGAASIGVLGRLMRSREAAEMARVALMPARRYIAECFASPEMTSLMAFFAMQTKTSLDEPGSALGMVELPWSHAGGVARARGGMSSVCDAIGRALESHGGRIVRDSHVEEILVRRGRAVGVRTSAGEEIGARQAVVAAISPVRTFGSLVKPEHLSPEFQRRITAIQVDNTCVIKCFYALSEAPMFTKSGDDGTCRGFRTAAGMLCPSLDHVDTMWLDIRARRLPTKIGWSWCTHTSSLDPTLAPDGKHTLGLHVWAPVELADGLSWDKNAKETMAMRLLDEYARCAPNVKDSLIAWAARSPIDYEQITDNPNGNMFHVDYVPHQTFGFRPLPELSDYRAPIAGLYLSGAGMHPGPAVTGLPGHNTAQVILADISKGDHDGAG
jgi:phytoene dehydrogenase-like protein